MNYTLNTRKIRELAKEFGMNTLGELCQQARIHKNSLTPYLQAGRSPFTHVIENLAKALNVSALDLIKVNDGDDNLVEIRSAIEPTLGPEHALFLFGSRARGTAKPFSDYDLGLSGGQAKLDFSTFIKIKSDIEEKLDNFSYSINLVNLDMAPLDFLLEIQPDLKFIIGNKQSANYFRGYIDGRKEN